VTWSKRISPRVTTSGFASGASTTVWTRASEFVQTPGHSADLGLELGGSLYFQSKDGALNDDPSQMVILT